MKYEKLKELLSDNEVFTEFIRALAEFAVLMYTRRIADFMDIVLLSNPGALKSIRKARLDE